MRYLFLILPLCSLFCCGHGGDVTLQAGDLLFQSGKDGLSDAIEAVTEGVGGYNFSHIGMLVPDSSGRLWVIEAVSKGVQLTPVDTFLRRGTRVAVGRVKDAYKPLLPAAMAFAVRQAGKPYDEEYIYDNGKYYCSELIYDAFLVANNHIPFFTLEPMTFKSPATGAFLEEWVLHYQKLNRPIPEGELGCNPGGLSQSGKIEIQNLKQ